MRTFTDELLSELPEALRPLTRVYDTVGSTSDAARTLAREGAPHGTAVISRGQTAGRGRMGRFFHSPAGAGLYLSLVWRPELAPERLMPMTALCGLALCDGLEELTGVRPGAKWPNDILYGGKKVCGILAEPALSGRGVEFVVLGVGINLLPAAFPPELRHTAVSLAEATGRTVSLAEAAAAAIKSLDAVPRLLTNPEGLAQALGRYAACCVTIGKSVRVSGPEGVRDGVAVGIDERAALLVRLPDGTVAAVTSGEATVMQTE